MESLNRLLCIDTPSRRRRCGQFALAGLLALPLWANAHIILDPDGATPPRNTVGVACGTRGDNPAVFAPGSRIAVDYIVQVKHGDTIRIDFSEANDQNFTDHPLAEFASHYGEGSKRVTLPNVECDACTLRIQESGYTSCADIRLKSPESMMTDTTPPMPLMAANANATDDWVALQWQNPETDFAETLWFMSYSDEDVMPETGHMYVEGQMIGDAKVVYVGDAEAHTVTALMPNTWVYFSAFARDDAGNYSTVSKVNVMTGDATPVPLALNVVVMQNNTILPVVEDTVWIDTSAGDVLVQAQASGPDNSHVMWQTMDTELMNTATAANEYIFDPAMLSEGNYTLTIDVHAGDEQVQQSVRFGVAPAPTASSSVAANNQQGQSKSGGAGGWLWVMLGVLGLLARKTRLA